MLKVGDSENTTVKKFHLSEETIVNVQYQKINEPKKFSKGDLYPFFLFNQTLTCEKSHDCLKLTYCDNLYNY